jgi:hypothetical protein
MYAPRLPLLRVHELEPDQAEELRCHLVGCAWCQSVLATYDIVEDALRRHFSPGGTALTEVTLEDIIRTTDREEVEPLVFDEPAPWHERASTSPPWREHIDVPHRRRRMSVVGAIEALAALLIIALLGGLLASRHLVGPGPASTPIPTTPLPTLDAQTQAYVTVLNTYYRPLFTAGVAAKQCYVQFENTGKLTDLLACRDPIASELAAAQTLRTQLATATPPPRWQSLHTALQQAVQGLIDVNTVQLAAIDAQDGAHFLSPNGRLGDVLSAFCPIFAQLNAGPPPLSPAFSPMDPGMC